MQSIVAFILRQAILRGKKGRLMQVYSKKIGEFIREIGCRVKDVLSREMGLPVAINRFYDVRRKFSYPISIVIYNHRDILGYFDPDFYELGFHECLMSVMTPENWTEK